MTIRSSLKAAAGTHFLRAGRRCATTFSDETGQSTDFRDEIAELKAEIAWLKGDGAEAVAALKTAFRLTPVEARLVIALARREQMSRAQILNALYSDRADDPPEEKTIDVMVCHARAKLGKTISILTVWGCGYRLNAKDRAAVLALIGESSSVPGSSPGLANGGKRI